MLYNKNPLSRMAIIKFRFTTEDVSVFSDLAVQALMIDEPLRASWVGWQIRTELLLSLIAFSSVFLKAEILSSKITEVFDCFIRSGGFLSDTNADSTNTNTEL
jgi:hypothetical protein